MDKKKIDDAKRRLPSNLLTMNRKELINLQALAIREIGARFQPVVANQGLIEMIKTEGISKQTEEIIHDVELFRKMSLTFILDVIIQTNMMMGIKELEEEPTEL